MKTASSGMTLIEIVIAMMIASLLSILLFQSFNQSQKTGLNFDGMVDYSFTMPIMYNQLHKDFSSIFVPEQVFKDLVEEYNTTKKSSPAEKAPIKDEEKTETFKNIFVYTLKDKNLELLSFLSTNSLSLFNTVIPHSVRVLYRLVPEHNGLSRLMRQETLQLNLPLDAFKKEKIREYELIRGIKALSIKFMIPEQTKDGKEKKSTETNYKTVEAWLPNETQKVDKKAEALVPEFIIIKGIVVHEVTQQEYSFEWWFHITAYEGITQRVANIKKKQKEKKEETASQQPLSSPDKLNKPPHQGGAS